MSFWLIICLIPLILLILFCLFILAVFVKDISENFFRDFLKIHGRRAEGIIIESEQYTGSGCHPADPCFKGKYEFKDHRGKRYHGKFSRYCFEPYDFANSKYSFQDAVKRYSKGASLDIYYAGWFPFIHIESIRWS